MEQAIKGQDAVIWCVGISMKGKYSEMLSLERHENLLRVMVKCGIKKLIDWTTPRVSSSRVEMSFVTLVPSALAGIVLKLAKQEILEIRKHVRDFFC